MIPSGRPEPSRGVLAGIKADLSRAKEAGTSYDPRGVGSAWSHNFLNQKPWHPMNFRNQIKLFDANQKHIDDQKAKEQALVEFNAEQEQLKTVSYLSSAEQKKYADRQSISFMYQKPPGLDAALAKEKEKEKPLPALEDGSAEGAAAGDGAAAGPASKKHKVQEVPRPPDRQQVMERLREEPYAAMVTARMALEQSDRLQFKYAVRGRSPTRGHIDSSAENQQFITDADDQPEPGEAEEGNAILEAVLAGLSEMERKKVMKMIAKKRGKEEKERQVAEAEALLRAAGLDPAAVRAEGKSSKHKHSHKHSSREHKHKRQRTF